MLAAVEGFGAIDDLAGMDFDGALAETGAFLSVVRADGFEAVFIAVCLVVAADLLVAVVLCVADLGAITASLGSSDSLTSRSEAGITVSDKLVAAGSIEGTEFSFPVGTLSTTVGVANSLAGSSTSGS